MLSEMSSLKEDSKDEIRNRWAWYRAKRQKLEYGGKIGKEISDHLESQIMQKATKGWEGKNKENVEGRALSERQFINISQI